VTFTYFPGKENTVYVDNNLDNQEILHHSHAPDILRIWKSPEEEVNGQK
jgi:hypothetical protein